MKKQNKIIFCFLFIFLTGCVNRSQQIADQLAVSCSYIKTEKDMIMRFGAPLSVLHVGDMTIYTYKWSAGVFHNTYSSFEIYKSCQLTFKNGRLVDYQTQAQA